MDNSFKKGVVKVSSLIFIIMTIVFCSTSSNSVGASNSLLKYAVLFLATIHLIYIYLKKEKKKLLFKKEIKLFLFFILVLVSFSIIYSVINEKISFRTVQEILFIVFPFLYSVMLINIASEKEIDNNIKISFIISFIFYIISLGLNFSLIIQNLFLTSWENSSSALESHIFCGYALAYCMYFLYYDKNKIFKYMSLLFVFMTFKRPFILIAIVMFLFSYSKNKNKIVNKKSIIAITICIFLIAIGYFQIMQPKNVVFLNNKYNINISKLTSTRSDRLRNLYNTSFKTYGFGSTTEYMYSHLDGSLEMDFIKIFIEVGAIPVIVLIYVYLSTARYTRYTFAIILFQLLNLIVTSSLTSCFAWMIIFITVFKISKEKIESEEKHEQENIDYNASL